MPQDVFDVQQKQGVLIVAPIGDAVGFRESDVNSGIDSVLEQIHGYAAPLVVADLANSSYFGSVIIGALAMFVEQVDAAGGRFVLCNVSDDMLAVLKVMRLNESWTICDSLRDAMSAVQAGET